MEGVTDARRPFDAKLIFGLVAAGLLAFIGFLVLTAYSGDFRSGRDGRAHALSVSAVGFKGITDLVGHIGFESHLVRSPEDHEWEDLLIVTLEMSVNADALAELIELRRGKATLLVLPKWTTVPHPERKAWVATAGMIPPEMLDNLLPEGLGLKTAQASGGARLAGRLFLSGYSMPAPKNLRTISGDAIEPMLVASDGSAVLAQMSDYGPFYILADPDLLNNQALKERDRASAALWLVEQLNATDAESVMFDLTLSGFEARENALKLAFQPPFLALTIALLAAGLLAGFHGAVRFGPASREERAIALGKAALVENSAGLIRLARREHRVGNAYADILRDAAGRDNGAPAGLTGAELEAYLDRMRRPGDRPFTELADAVRHADDRLSLLQAARNLYLWKKDLV